MYTTAIRLTTFFRKKGSKIEMVLVSVVCFEAAEL